MKILEVLERAKTFYKESPTLNRKGMCWAINNVCPVYGGYYL